MTTTLKLGGVDLRNYIDVIEQWTNLVGLPTVNGNDLEMPGQVGALSGGQAQHGPRTITIAGTLLEDYTIPVADSSSFDGGMARLRALAALVFNSGRTHSLTRVLSIPGSADQIAIGTGRYLAGLDQAEIVAQGARRVSIDFSLLEGKWHGSDTVSTGYLSSDSFAITALGDTDTRRVKVSLKNTDANCRVTNSSAGTWVQCSAAGDGTAIVMDADEYTAVHGSSNYIAKVSHSQDTDYAWMMLRPGVNNFTVSGRGSGTVQVEYNPAFL